MKRYKLRQFQLLFWFWHPSIIVESVESQLVAIVAECDKVGSVKTLTSLAYWFDVVNFQSHRISMHATNLTGEVVSFNYLKPLG